MGRVHGTQAGGIKGSILKLSLTLLVLSLAGVRAARADGWSAGALTTYDQAEWGDETSAAGNLLANEYGAVYAEGGDLFEIGAAGPGLFVEFTSGSHLGDFLPASGAFKPLNTDLENPTTTPAGIFAGEVAGLKLNIDFSAAGLLPGTSGLNFG